MRLSVQIVYIIVSVKRNDEHIISKFGRYTQKGSGNAQQCTDWTTGFSL
jgi:hypothetical protein